MRFDHNLQKFISHDDWYITVIGKGYIPTEKAPEEARKAMEEYNSYIIRNKENNQK